MVRKLKVGTIKQSDVEITRTMEVKSTGQIALLSPKFGTYFCADFFVKYSVEVLHKILLTVSAVFSMTTTRMPNSWKVQRDQGRFNIESNLPRRPDILQILSPTFTACFPPVFVHMFLSVLPLN